MLIPYIINDGQELFQFHSLKCGFTAFLTAVHSSTYNTMKVTLLFGVFGFLLSLSTASPQEGDDQETIPQESDDQDEIPQERDSRRTTQGSPKLVGHFSNKSHGVSGRAYTVNSTTILIKNFTYDGLAPDAFFWVGTKNKLNAVLPYPFLGVHYNYSDEDIPILGRFRGDEGDITLHLPQRIGVQDIKWLSVWCRKFKLNFGHVVFTS